MVYFIEEDIVYESWVWVDWTLGSWTHVSTTLPEGAIAFWDLPSPSDNTWFRTGLQRSSVPNDQQRKLSSKLRTSQQGQQGPSSSVWMEFYVSRTWEGSNRTSHLRLLFYSEAVSEMNIKTPQNPDDHRIKPTTPPSLSVLWPRSRRTRWAWNLWPIQPETRLLGQVARTHNQSEA